MRRQFPASPFGLAPARLGNLQQSAPAPVGPHRRQEDRKANLLPSTDNNPDLGLLHPSRTALPAFRAQLPV